LYQSAVNPQFNQLYLAVYFLIRVIREIRGKENILYFNPVVSAFAFQSCTPVKKT
jgi:hypothetical protein